MYNVSNEMKFKTSMMSSNSCDYSDAYIRVKGPITVRKTAVQGAAPNNKNKNRMSKISASFTNYINEIHNTQEGDTHDTDA